MKTEEILAVAHRLAEAASPDRGGYSSISAGRAVGATIGSLCAATIVGWMAPPALAAAFLLATLAVGGRTLGGWITARRLWNAKRISWEHVEMLSRILRDFGVRNDLVGPLVAELVRGDPRPAVLNDPVRILQLLPKEAFQQVEPIASANTGRPALGSASPTQINSNSD
jgi:hypothetical protein